ncbi:MULTISPECIES: tyrosine--tRNA ligase [Anaerotruncus]|uniref:Tyrosine--tRNA ligase n=2 Tax=Anaerotruncus TaxID=244127 RepID=A0A498CUA5_9FIRM|nr:MULTISPECIES: tyrosine--tRNA ligase [Anaerotruncus]MBC3937439.1 tyrosine--tRNA ligase [Anaerotruncus massiliensis (ex Togo et al. 2019)]MCQ4894524.1 tyrosine--tRNA ligase [Anaerotruncus sp. DFI.9.16]RLL14559.1 tyrosine--tRNA ligase [Anaerotruncus massiliensis (ex Liu et al. 2021)]
MTVFEELTRRGLIAQMTHPEKIEELLNNEKVTFYIGFDATADSLHVGHFLQLVVMRRLQLAGHRPIALLGTGTTLIGDPTGRTDMRKMLTPEAINYNAECFKRQMEKFIDFSDNRALMLRNGDWLCKLNYIELLRDVGVYFSVNQMLTMDSVKTRLERGLSFLEFNYMIMQSYDFLKLHRDYGCRMELGGNDQWANILGGIDLTRRVTGDEVYGMTFTLLTTKEGKKMGKTENGAVWLDPEKTSPYEFFQYWRNVADADVINCLKLLTFLPIEEIEAMESWEGSQLNQAKETLAYELTKMVHGQQEADKALAAARALFGAGSQSDDMPTTTLSAADLAGGRIAVADLLVKTGLAPSKGEAKRLIQQGGVSVDDEKVSDFTAEIGADAFEKGHVILKKGKKIYHKVLLG